MPLYSFKCPNCQHEFEQLMSYEESKQVSCQECGWEAKRQVTAASVQFKGGGWPGEEIRKSKGGIDDRDSD